MTQHAPLKFVTGLSAKLAARTRHVCVFLGAGASRACGLPDVATLQKSVLTDLDATQRAAFEVQLTDRNLEQALSRLRRIAGLLSGEQTVDGLTSAAATMLDAAVCASIVRQLNVEQADLEPAYRFAAWAARADYRQPIEIFNVNYDLIIETAFERLRVPYFDGFVGALEARFHTDLVETRAGGDAAGLPSFFVRLWKLHGSVNWEWKKGEIARLGQPVSSGQPAAIYPSETKYEESRRMPFVVLHDRFRRALNEPETIILMSGYSFCDDHLNELIFEAARRRERSEFVAFCYSALPENLVKRALVTPNLQVVGATEAILGGIRAEWKAPDEPPPNMWENDKFLLGDFKHLAAFLARTGASDSIEEQLQSALQSLLTPKTVPNAKP
ncbi:MAG TPA: SIR2 family protein [Thermoanaerobaculia bacterium]|nr:SIR2 family protein [Thermoanaerobaculia bacterium]